MDQNTIYIAVAVVVLLVIVLLIVNRNKSRRTTATGARTGQTGPGEGSDEARLAHLADLRSKGLVTEQEFESQRRQILGKM